MPQPDDATLGAASIAEGTARYTSKESTRCALGTKRVVPSVLELPKASRKAHVPVPKEATASALAEQVAVECKGNNRAAAEVRVTTAIAGGFVETVTACADFGKSPDVHTPLGGVIAENDKVISIA